MSTPTAEEVDDLIDIILERWEPECVTSHGPVLDPDGEGYVLKIEVVF